jgi:hypothetical protein
MVCRWCSRQFGLVDQRSAPPAPRFFDDAEACARRAAEFGERIEDY